MSQECPICLDALTGDSLWHGQGCKHMLHQECALKLQQSALAAGLSTVRCPVCRRAALELVPISVRNAALRTCRLECPMPLFDWCDRAATVRLHQLRYGGQRYAEVKQAVECLAFAGYDGCLMQQGDRGHPVQLETFENHFDILLRLSRHSVFAFVKLRYTYPWFGRLVVEDAFPRRPQLLLMELFNETQALSLTEGRSLSDSSDCYLLRPAEHVWRVVHAVGAQDFKPSLPSPSAGGVLLEGLLVYEGRRVF